MSPGWQQQLAFTLTLTTSYEGAAALLRHHNTDPAGYRLAQKLLADKFAELETGIV